MTTLNRTNNDLAAEIKAWRGAVPARVAAERLGIPKRTLDGIEQGRPFRYAHLLKLAMQAVDLKNGRLQIWVDE